MTSFEINRRPFGWLDNSEFPDKSSVGETKFMNSFTTTINSAFVIMPRFASRQRLTFLQLCVSAFVFLNGSFSPVYAQDQGVAARFPDPAQINADYPDPAQRFAAFTVLSEAIAQCAPKPISKTDYARLFAYQAGAAKVTAMEMAEFGENTPASNDFNAHCNQYANNENFVTALLGKYHLNGLPTYATPPPTVEEEMKYDVPTHLPQALPWILAAGVVPMALAAWLVLRGSGIGRKIYPVPAPVRNGLPALPKSLQVVSLPGVRYATYVMSGRVLDIQTSSHTSSHTHTTGGDTYQSPSGQVHTTPTQTWTSTTNIRESIIWVRLPDNREVSWTLYNTTFQCRIGQIISALVRPLKTGEGEILLAYNHTAGVLEKCAAFDKSHEPRGNELGQWAANIAGGYTAAKVLNLFLPMYAGRELDMGFVVSWIAATLMLVTVSFFILTPLVKSFILKRRNARFNSKYLPGFRQFFERGTPFLQSSLRPL